MALKREIKWGSRFLLNAAVINIGKYGTGTKTIMLPMKLINSIPRYPKSS